MTIVYRDEKGSPLTADEVDGNFHDLDDRITEFEAGGSQAPRAIELIRLAESGVALEVVYTDATVDGPFPIPSTTWTGQGAWTNSTPYAVNDIVEVPGVGFFLVLENHTTPAAPEEFDPDAVNGSDEPLYQQIGAFPSTVDPIAFSFYGTLPSEQQTATDGELIGTFVLTEACTLEEGLPLSRAYLHVPAASSDGVVLDIEKNGTVIGQVDFDTDEQVGTFVFDADVTFTGGDVIQLFVQAADGIAAHLAVTLRAIRL